MLYISHKQIPRPTLKSLNNITAVEHVISCQRFLVSRVELYKFRLQDP